MLKFRPVFGAVVTRSRTFLRGGERCSSPLPSKFDRVCCDVIKRRVAWFLHQGVGCNMSEGSEERLMDHNQDLNQDRDQDRDLKRSERGGEEEEQIQATKRRRTTAEDQKQEQEQEQRQEQKQERDQDQDGDNRKCPKKKVALLMAYSGKGYYGMQVQTGAGSSASGVPIWECDRVVLCVRGTLGAPCSGPSKTTWSAPSSSLAAFLRTTART